MNDRILISIIVPVYNVENELERCVDSIMNQTWENIEVILVDDGSSDHSKDVIRRLAQQDDRILPIYKENGGVSSARLAGIHASHGEWIGFVDSDDMIDPEMFERLFSNAIETGAGISHCGYKMCFTGGRVNYFYNTGKKIVQDRCQGIRDLLEGEIIEPGLWNKLFRRDIVEKFLQKYTMDTTIKINEDLLMNYYLFSIAEKSVFEDWCPYSYMVRAESVSRQEINYNKIHDPIKVKEIILANVEGANRQDAQKALVNTAIYGYGALCQTKLFKSERSGVRQVIVQNRRAISYLPKRTALLGKVIIFAPWLFAVAYPIYVRYIQKSKYT